MKVSFVQFSPEFGKVRSNVYRVMDILESLSTDLVVLPELFNTGYYFTDRSELAALAEEIPNGFTTNSLLQVANRKKFHVVAGILEKEGDKFYNSAALIGPGGYIDSYRKIHLYSEEKIYFTPGDKPFTVHNIGRAKVGMMICFDWIFPESMRTLALLGADIICHPANLVMPYCPDLLPAQCFLSRVWAITANRVGKDEKDGKSLSFFGKSQIISPAGEILERAGEYEEASVTVEINPEDARNKVLNPYNDLINDRRPEFYICDNR